MLSLEKVWLSNNVHRDFGDRVLLFWVRVYVDGLAVLYSPVTAINQLLWMPNGPHRIELVAEDTAGYIATSTLQVNVVAQQGAAVGIQNNPYWISCSAVLASEQPARLVWEWRRPHFRTIKPRRRWMGPRRNSALEAHSLTRTNCIGLRLAAATA